MDKRAEYKEKARPMRNLNEHKRWGKCITDKF